MGSKETTRRKRKKLFLFGKQNGCCHWCSVPMELTFHEVGKQWDTLATLDHLDDRFSAERGKHYGEYRVVLACSKCNFERGVASQSSRPLEELHERSRRHPRQALLTTNKEPVGEDA